MSEDRQKALRLARYWLEAALAGKRLHMLDPVEPLNTAPEVFKWYEFVSSFFYVTMIEYVFLTYGFFFPLLGTSTFETVLLFLVDMKQVQLEKI